MRFAFDRFDTADLSFRALARELEAKGFPSPGGTGWTQCNVSRLLRTKAYAGTAEWGATSWGKYHTARGEDIIPTGNGKQRKNRKKPQEDAIAVENAHEGIVPLDLFNRVQRKLPQPKPYQPKRKADYPLAGLIFCGHCGKPMHGHTQHAKNEDRQYAYTQYICSTYANHMDLMVSTLVAETRLTPSGCSAG